MQRMHLSGDVFRWQNEETFELVKEGVAVYKATRSDIDSAIPFYPLGNILVRGEKSITVTLYDKKSALFIFR